MNFEASRGRASDVPSHQSLHFGYRASIERHLGLIVQLEAAPFDRPPEIYLKLEGSSVHAGTKHLVSPFGSLDLIQGRVRIPKEVGRDRAMSPLLGASRIGAAVTVPIRSTP
jgi:hypothetical protein